MNNLSINSAKNLQFLVTSEEKDQTILSFLKKRLKKTPISLIYKLFRCKKVQINQNNCRYYHYRLREKDQITIKDKRLTISSQVKTLPKKPKIKLKVYYEDNRILVALKAHNQEIYQKNNPDCLDNQVQFYLYQQNPAQYQKQVKRFFWPVALHRLDKLTRGLVIYPKTPTVRKILYLAIGQKELIEKKYLLVCENQQKTLIPAWIRGWIEKNSTKQKMEFSFEKNSAQAKYCALTSQKIGEQGIYQLYQIALETGRKHQIRTIFSFLGCPVVGDQKYGSRTSLKDKIFLFAYQLKFKNLPSPLAYLNQKIFSLSDLAESLTQAFNSSNYQFKTFWKLI